MIDWFISLVFMLLYPGLNLERGARLRRGKNSTLKVRRSRIGRLTKVKITKNGSLFLKKKSWIGSFSTIEAKNVSVGRNSTIHDHAAIYGDVTIGDFVLIAKNVYISSGKHHFEYMPELPIRIQDECFNQNVGQFSSSITIEDDVWIGANCTILNGVTIGKGSIIGGNSFVNKDVPPYSVFVGSPAKELKKRLIFDPPEHIRSSSMSDLPYFYSGFELTNVQDAANNIDYVFKAYNEFTLALNKGSATSITLLIKSCVNNAVLSFEGQSELVGKDFISIKFDLKQPDINSRYQFSSGLSNSKVCFEIKEAFLSL